VNQVTRMQRVPLLIDGAVSHWLRVLPGR
jgi:hypothetical protein